MTPHYTVHERKEIAEALWRIFQLDATKILLTYTGDRIIMDIHLTEQITFDDGRPVQKVKGIIKGDTRYFENVTVIGEEEE